MSIKPLIFRFIIHGRRPVSNDFIKTAMDPLIRLWPHKMGGVIRGFDAEFRPESTDLVKTVNIGRRYPMIQCGIPPESTDLIETANISRR